MVGERIIVFQGRQRLERQPNGRNRDILPQVAQALVAIFNTRILNFELIHFL